MENNYTLEIQYGAFIRTELMKYSLKVRKLSSQKDIDTLSNKEYHKWLELAVYSNDIIGFFKLFFNIAENFPDHYYKEYNVFTPNSLARDIVYNRRDLYKYCYKLKDEDKDDGMMTNIMSDFFTSTKKINAFSYSQELHNKYLNSYFYRYSNIKDLRNGIISKYMNILSSHIDFPLNSKNPSKNVNKDFGNFLILIQNLRNDFEDSRSFLIYEKSEKIKRIVYNPIKCVLSMFAKDIIPNIKLNDDAIYNKLDTDKFFKPSVNSDMNDIINTVAEILDIYNVNVSSKNLNKKLPEFLREEDLVIDDHDDDNVFNNPTMPNKDNALPYRGAVTLNNDIEDIKFLSALASLQDSVYNSTFGIESNNNSLKEMKDIISNTHHKVPNFKVLSEIDNSISDRFDTNKIKSSLFTCVTFANYMLDNSNNISFNELLDFMCTNVNVTSNSHNITDLSRLNHLQMETLNPSLKRMSSILCGNFYDSYFFKTKDKDYKSKFRYLFVTFIDHTLYCLSNQYSNHLFDPLPRLLPMENKLNMEPEEYSVKYSDDDIQLMLNLFNIDIIMNDQAFHIDGYINKHMIDVFEGRFIFFSFADMSIEETIEYSIKSIKEYHNLDNNILSDYLNYLRIFCNIDTHFLEDEKLELKYS